MCGCNVHIYVCPQMLNSVVHAVTMEICLAILSSSAEEMVMNIIKMSIQYISCARANQIVSIALYSYSLIGVSHSEPHMYEKYSERVCIYTYIYI